MIQQRFSIEDLSRKLKPIFGEKIDQLYFQYLVASTNEERNEIVQILTGLYQKNLNKLLDKDVLLEPPKEGSLNGEYPLAKVSYAKKQLFDFSLREQDWPRHVCISGMSGSGKTTFAFNVLKNFIEKDKSFLVFDWKKSFRPLMGIDPSISCFTIGNNNVSNLFKTNINIPPKGVSPKEWINVLCDLITESFCVSFGVHKILLETLDEIYEGWGVYEGSKHYPNWKHVKKMLEDKSREAKGRETGWYESALRVATVLTFGSFGDVVNYDGKKCLSVEDIFDKRMIFELNSLSNIEKKFFCEFVLTYIYKLKKASPDKVNSKFDHAILVDEAHNIFLKNKTNFVSESTTDMIYREMREYGTSLICLDQHVSKLSDTVVGNSACHVAFQQQLPQDIHEISSLMQLAHNKEIFSQLPVGSAIVKLAERVGAPFLIEVPFLDLRDHEVSDEEIASRTRAILEFVEVEKHDPEFKEEMIKEREVPGSPEVKIVETSIQGTEVEVVKAPVVEEVQVPMSNLSYSYTKPVESKVDKVQKILYDFACTQLEQGKNLKEIESLLRGALSENQYTGLDISNAINLALNDQFAEPVKDYLEGLDSDEARFVEFLVQNEKHEKSTVELYKAVGLSSRKGNEVKKKLIAKGLIRTEEEKNMKGWKKHIRHNIHNIKTISNNPNIA